MNKIVILMVLAVAATTAWARPQGLIGGIIGGLTGGNRQHFQHRPHPGFNNQFGGAPHRPGGFGGFQPAGGFGVPGFVNPLGSGTGSGAGTAAAGPGGVSASGVAISSATNGGFGVASGQGSSSQNFFTGQSNAQASGQGQSGGR